MLPMAPPLVDLLCHRAVAVRDPATRVQLFRSLVADLPAATVREVSAALVERAGMRDHGAQLALLALQGALSTAPAVPPPPRRPPAVTNDDDDADLAAPEPPPPEEPQVPDYGRGRPLSLGERKSLARGRDRRFLDRALRDPHPDVIMLLLQNPRITEADVVRICALRPGRPAVLRAVFASPRWVLRPAVRRALAYNPATPEEITGALVPMLPPADLREIARDGRVPVAVRRRCFEVLGRLEPLPGNPSEIH